VLSGWHVLFFIKLSADSSCFYVASGSNELCLFHSLESKAAVILLTKMSGSFVTLFDQLDSKTNMFSSLSPEVLPGRVQEV
jgi:hypothetical protein